MEIFKSLPSQYAMILMVSKHGRPFSTPEEAMHDLLEDDTTASLTKEFGDTTMGATRFSQRGGYHGRGHWRGGPGGRGACSGPGGSSGT